MVKARKYVVKRHFQGVPRRDDFELVEQELPPLKNGDALVKAEWISVDPCLRAYNSLISDNNTAAGSSVENFQTLPYDQFSSQVGVVIESKSDNFPVGSRIVSQKGWCDYSIVNPKDKLIIDLGVYGSFLKRSIYTVQKEKVPAK